MSEWMRKGLGQFVGDDLAGVGSSYLTHYKFNCRQNQLLAKLKDSNLFLAPDRATLTFIANNEVASIHFDLSHKEIYYKGRNIKNLQLSALQIEYLENFGEELANRQSESELSLAYFSVLNKVIG